MEHCTEMAFFVTCVQLASTCNFVWPPNASLCAQVGISKLATPFGQGFMPIINMKLQNILQNINHGAGNQGLAMGLEAILSI